MVFAVTKRTSLMPESRPSFSADLRREYDHAPLLRTITWADSRVLQTISISCRLRSASKLAYTVPNSRLSNCMLSTLHVDGLLDQQVFEERSCVAPIDSTGLVDRMLSIAC